MSSLTSRPAKHSSNHGKAVKESQQPKWKKTKPSASPNPPAKEDMIDPKLIDQPVERLVHESLRNAWVVNKSRPMCLIFDCVNPARQFKRGVLYDLDETTPFPNYDPDPERDGNVMEGDEGPHPGLQPYNPAIPECVYSLSAVGY